MALVLVASAGRPRSRAAGWAWGMVGVGVFVALGAHNPVAAWLFGLPGAGAFRYPVKVWPLVAVGAALLCGIGFQRTVGRAIGRGGGDAESRPPRLLPPASPWASSAVCLLAVGAVLVLAPDRFEALVLALRAGELAGPVRGGRADAVAGDRDGVGGAAGGAGRRPRPLPRPVPAVGAALLLALQAAGQVFFLRRWR